MTPETWFIVALFGGMWIAGALALVVWMDEAIPRPTRRAALARI